METLVQQLENNAVKYADRTALIYKDRKYTYRDLNHSVNAIAHSFIKYGVRNGDIIATMLPRVPENVISFLAAAKASAILAPINYEMPEKEIGDVLETLLPKFLVVHADSYELAIKSLPRGLSCSIILVGNTEGPSGCLLWEDIVREFPQINPGLTVREEDVVYLNYTSGSTGQSKGAIVTHANIYWNTRASVESLGLTHDDIHLCMFAPFAHPHEIFARPLYLGGTIVLVDLVYPKSIAKAIQTHKVTCIMALSPIYQSLMTLSRHNQYDLSSLRVAESGGMYTHPTLIQSFKFHIGIPIVAVWGSTETTGIAISNRPAEGVVPGSVGRPCPYYEVKVVDKKGYEVGANEIGEFIFKGPGVVGGYYKGTEQQNACFRDGWYYSGDLGKKDEKGNFYFLSRRAEMMKVAGLKVYPLEIELVTVEIPGVEEVVVIPVADKMRGEIPKARVVPKQGITLTQEHLMGFWQKKLPRYKIPRIVEIRDSLPKKPGNGKIDKKRLVFESA